MTKPLSIGVIGGGSLFTPELIDLIARNTDFTGPVEVKLMDVSKRRLETVGAFCERLLKKLDRPLTLRYVNSYEEAIKGSDFIFVQFRVGFEEARISDDKIGLKHKIPFVETVTVCGLGSFLRTYYQMELIAELVKKYAPDAWVMNFANPSGVLTESLHKLGCKRVAGICNGSMSFMSEVAGKLNADARDIFINWRGLNHLTFVDHISYKGENVYDKIVDNLEENGGGCVPFPKRLIRSIGYIPSSYLQFIYLKEKIVDKLQHEDKTRAETVQEVNRALLELYGDESLDTLPEILMKRGGFGYSRSVADLIKGIVTNERSIHYAQVQNGSIFRELPPDAYVEVPVLAMDNEIRAIHVEELPDMAKPLVVTMKRYEQSLIAAARNHSRRDLYNAMLINPLFGSDCLSEPILSDILDANKAYIPSFT